MTRVLRTAYLVLAVSSTLALTFTATAQINPDLYAGLNWRNAGPFHGGRISSLTGVIGQPGTFYAGTPLGAIWKTTSAGVTWFPIFDQAKSVDRVGAIQVAPSNPDIVYAGDGDPISGSLGNGMWKSTDAGKTWQHIGLEDTVKITSIVVDPADPGLVLVSALGDSTRHGGGVYRSTGGGQTWNNVLKPADYDVSLTNIKDKRPMQYAVDENIRDCRYYLLLLSDDWGPAERNFRNDYHLALECLADGSLPMQSVAVLARSRRSGAPLTAGMPEPHQAAFSTLPEFDECVNGLLANWLESLASQMSGAA